MKLGNFEELKNMKLGFNFEELKRKFPEVGFAKELVDCKGIIDGEVFNSHIRKSQFYSKNDAALSIYIDENRELVCPVGSIKWYCADNADFILKYGWTMIHPNEKDEYLFAYYYDNNRLRTATVHNDNGVFTCKVCGNNDSDVESYHMKTIRLNNKYYHYCNFDIFIVAICSFGRKLFITDKDKDKITYYPIYFDKVNEITKAVFDCDC